MNHGTGMDEILCLFFLNEKAYIYNYLLRINNIYTLTT